MFDAMEMDLINQKVVRMNEKFDRNLDASCILFHNEMIEAGLDTSDFFKWKFIYTMSSSIAHWDT